MATKTAKGENSAKASGTELELLSVGMTEGESLLPAVLFKGQHHADLAIEGWVNAAECEVLN